MVNLFYFQLETWFAVLKQVEDNVRKYSATEESSGVGLMKGNIFGPKITSYMYTKHFCQTKTLIKAEHFLKEHKLLAAFYDRLLIEITILKILLT